MGPREEGGPTERTERGQPAVFGARGDPEVLAVPSEIRIWRVRG